VINVENRLCGPNSRQLATNSFAGTVLLVERY
jgi:hypothetical protein